MSQMSLMDLVSKLSAHNKPIPSSAKKSVSTMGCDTTIGSRLA